MHDVTHFVSLQLPDVKEVTIHMVMFRGSSSWCLNILQESEI